MIISECFQNAAKNKKAMTKEDIIKILKPKCNGTDLPTSLNVDLIAELLTYRDAGSFGTVKIAEFSTDRCGMCDYREQPVDCEACTYCMSNNPSSVYYDIVK